MKKKPENKPAEDKVFRTKYADPKNDFAFKKIFGDEKRTNILISFLNAVLDFKGDQTIVEVTKVDSQQLSKRKEIKDTVLDVYAKTKTGEQFIVEMQNQNQHDFKKRAQYYMAQAYVNQLSKGEEYHKLARVYFIGILNFKVFDSTHYLSRHFSTNQETNNEDLSDWRHYFIELPKFTLDIEQLKYSLDKWVYFLKHAIDLDTVPAVLQEDSNVGAALEVALQVSWSEDERNIYDYKKRKASEHKSAIDTGRMEGKTEGRIEGKAEGLVEGEAIGEAKGIVKGKAEGKREEALSIAASLIGLLDTATIADKTGLNISEVEELRSSSSKEE